MDTSIKAILTWRDPERVGEWMGELSKEKPVVVYCAFGFHVGCRTAIALRDAGFDTRYMTVGHSGWRAVGAIVPFLYAGVVHDHQWLTERQFVDAVAVAMITPGPVVITVGFIGYLIAGLPGALVAALGTFLPCYLFTVLPAPYFKKYGKRPDLLAFVAGVTAAAIGAITGAVIVLAERAIVDLLTAVMALVTAGLIWKVKKLPESVLVAIAVLIGLVAFPGGSR
jgi:putative chromate ion transporter